MDSLAGQVMKAGPYSMRVAEEPEGSDPLFLWHPEGILGSKDFRGLISSVERVLVKNGNLTRGYLHLKS